MKTRFLLSVNKLFPEIPHPFNMRTAGTKSYPEWEFERGADTLKNYMRADCAKDESFILSGLKILDIGAGAAGKSVYYLTHGAAHVTAIDILPDYKDEAEAFAKRLGVGEKFTYAVGDAAKLPFEDASFDAVIMNDAFEHVREPEKVLCEIGRVLRDKGRVYINFPPYNHPYGAHLSDTIRIPWVHLFFSEETLVSAYKLSVKKLPDGDARVKFRISKDARGNEYFSYINKMTLKRFENIRKNSTLTELYYNEIPLRPYLSVLARNNLTREAFVKCAVCILEKSAPQS